MALVKIGAQAEEKLWEEIRALADKENAKLYAIINEAFKDLLEKRKQAKPRKAVMDHFAGSLADYDSLYKKLAK
jgi:hypothetical protein